MARLLSLILGAALALLAVAYVIYDGWAWDRAAKVVDSGFRQLAVAQTNERPGGIFLENDSYYWLSYARRIGEGKSWRVRYTFADNTPYGRPVHWSQSISWLLVIFGKTRQALTGESWVAALEQTSVWINPALLILLISGIGWALFRRVGPVAAGLFSINLVSLGDVGWTFQPLRPGHQSLYCLFGLLTLAGVVFGGAGWICESESSRNPVITPGLGVPRFQSAKRWFLVSGASAALGLWISAVSSTMLLGMLFAAGLLLALRAPKLPEGSELEVRPELWRWWGWIAGAGSLLFYLVEYFPNHLTLFRLEVNGPLYSLAVVAMGEALCQFLRARYAASGEGAAGPFMKGLFCAVIVALVPLAILCGPVSWHALRDPQMWRLHNFIQEFYSLPRFAGSNPVALFLKNVGILPLFFVMAVALAASSSLRAHERTAVWLSFVVALGLLGLGYLQIRWLGLYAVMNAWLAVVAGTCAWRFLCERLPRRLQPSIGILLVALLLVQPVLFVNRRNRQVGDIIRQSSIPRQLVDPVLNKRLALAFLAEEGSGARVMAGLDLAPCLHYFGQAAVVASYYWENVDGLHAATRFFADSDGQEARQVALERGLTHVMVQEGNSLENYFYFIATGKLDQEAAKSIFAARLVGSEFALPDWLQTTPALRNIGYRVYTYRGMRFEDRWRIYRISRQP